MQSKAGAPVNASCVKVKADEDVSRETPSVVSERSESKRACVGEVGISPCRWCSPLNGQVSVVE